MTEKNMNAKSSLSIGVSKVLQPKVIILDQFQTAADAISEMRNNSARSVLVSNKKQEVIGLVSKTDILYKVLSLHKSTARVLLEEIMSTPIISIPPDMSVGDALTVMEKRDIRQIVVSANSKIYGMIDREDIISKMEKALMETN